jgi:hypothetical protein
MRSAKAQRRLQVQPHRLLNLMQAHPIPRQRASSAIFLEDLLRPLPAGRGAARRLADDLQILILLAREGSRR